MATRRLRVGTALLTTLLLAGCGGERARTNTLKNDVQRLESKVRRLEERIAKLERAESARQGMVSIVGTYVVDPEPLVEMLLPEAIAAKSAELEKLAPEARKERERELRELLRVQARAMDISLVLAPDGTCELVGADADADQTGTGQWRVEGDRLTLDFTVDPKDPDVMSARIEGTRLYVDDPKLVLQKR